MRVGTICGPGTWSDAILPLIGAVCCAGSLVVVPSHPVPVATPTILLAASTSPARAGQGQSLAEVAEDAVVGRASMSRIAALNGGAQSVTVRPAIPQFPPLWSELRVETRYLTNPEMSEVLRRDADLAVNGPLADRVAAALTVGADRTSTGAPAPAVQVLPDPRRYAELPMEWVNFTPRPPLEVSPDEVINAALALLGVPPALHPVFASFVRYVIAHESGGDVNAVNRWDSNAIGEVQSDGARLQSSRGWMQTIPQTFARFHAPGTSANVYDPVANICAALRYMAHRYGVNLVTGDGIQQFLARRAGGYLGY